MDAAAEAQAESKSLSSMGTKRASAAAAPSLPSREASGASRGGASGGRDGASRSAATTPPPAIITSPAHNDLSMSIIRDLSPSDEFEFEEDRMASPRVSTPLRLSTVDHQPNIVPTKNESGPYPSHVYQLTN